MPIRVVVQILGGASLRQQMMSAPFLVLINRDLLHQALHLDLQAIYEGLQADDLFSQRGVLLAELILHPLLLTLQSQGLS